MDSRQGGLMADKETKEAPAEAPPPLKVKHEQPKGPIVEPDGHVTLSQEDLDARD
jgi:hypothetical protein